MKIPFLRIHSNPIDTKTIIMWIIVTLNYHSQSWVLKMALFYQQKTSTNTNNYIPLNPIDIKSIIMIHYVDSSPIKSYQIPSNYDYNPIQISWRSHF